MIGPVLAAILAAIAIAVITRRGETIPEKIENVKNVKMTMVEVEHALDELAAKRSERLDHRRSITDLTKLLNLDSSPAARNALALELGYKGPLDGSAEMNIQLHKLVMAAIAERCIPVPK